LAQFPRNLGIDGLVVIGVATNTCVGMTVQRRRRPRIQDRHRGGRDRGSSPLLHEPALLGFAHLFGPVRTTVEMIANLGLEVRAGRS
jgi:nicotinamidase-related amidase